MYMMNWLKKLMSLILVNFLKNKISEIDSKISSITNLATTAALNAAKNKISNVSNLVTKRL